MKLSVWIGLIFTLLFHLHSAAAEGGLGPGLYQIKGTHSALGNYEGMLSVSAQGRAQRFIQISPRTVDQLRFVGLAPNQEFGIQQLWEGSLTPAGLVFRIRMSNVLTRFNDFTPAVSDFSVEEILISKLNPSFQLRNEGRYSETYKRLLKDPVELFQKDQRIKMDAYGETGSFLVNLAGWGGVSTAVNEYRKLPHFDAYRDREEFQKHQVFQIKDLTDLEFYRENPSQLRLRNKSVTPLSVGEAMQRRAAYRPTLHEKAEYKSRETRSVMNELGLFEEGDTDEQGHVVSLSPQGDSTLWFGVYVWSLYLQNQVLNTSETYDHLRAGIQSFNHFIEISPDPTLFARWIHRSPPEETSTNPNVRQGTGVYADFKYDSRSNNDMVKGILLNYLMAYKGLRANEKELRHRIAEIVIRLQQIDPIRSKAGNLAMARGLDALWNENPDSLRDFIDGIDNFINFVGDQFYVNSGFHVGGMANPSGIHLNLISLSIKYLLADELIKKVKQVGERMYILKPMPENTYNNFIDPTPRLKAIKKSAEKNIKLLTFRMSKAYFNYLNIAAYALTKDEKLKARAIESVYGLMEVPIVRSVGNMAGDLLQQPDWMYSSWPFEPWTAWKGLWRVDKDKLSKKDQRRGVFGYPIFECAGMGSTYLWVDGTNDYPCGGSVHHIAFSADYLWAYWLARSAQVISEKE